MAGKKGVKHTQTGKNMNWSLYPISDFNRFHDQWDDFNRETFNTPLLYSAFVQPLLDYFSNGEEKLAILEVSGSTRAMGILSKANRLGAWTTFQPSQAPVGIWLQHDELDLHHSLDRLFGKLPLLTLLFSITQQDPDLLPRPVDKGRLSTLDYIDTARITINGSFDDYWAARGKNLRHNLKRQRNRMDREGVEIEMKIIDSPNDVEQAIASYGTLESAGWKNSLGTAIAIDNAQGRFYCDMLRNFLSVGQGMIFQYYYNRKLVATDLCILGSGTFIILKTTYDENIKTSSPAMLMRQEEFRYIFTNHLADRIEFYGKVMDWHSKWSNETRTMYHINYAKTRLLP